MSQDFRIGEAIRRSQGAGRELRLVSDGAQLRPRAARATTCARSTTTPTCCAPELAGLPRIVYEFDSPDLRTGTMYPAMARDLPRGRRAVRRDVRLRHAADRVAQPRLADALPEPGLHAAQGDERRDRGRGDAPAAADARLRRVSAEHPASATSASHDGGSGRAGRARRLPLRRLDAHRAAGSAALRASPATARRPSWPTRARGRTSSTACATGRLAARGVSRRGAGPRSLRAARARTRSSRAPSAAPGR